MKNIFFNKTFLGTNDKKFVAIFYAVLIYVFLIYFLGKFVGKALFLSHSLVEKKN